MKAKSAAYTLMGFPPCPGCNALPIPLGGDIWMFPHTTDCKVARMDLPSNMERIGFIPVTEAAVPVLMMATSGRGATAKLLSIGSEIAQSGQIPPISECPAVAIIARVAGTTSNPDDDDDHDAPTGKRIEDDPKIRAMLAGPYRDKDPRFL